MISLEDKKYLSKKEAGVVMYGILFSMGAMLIVNTFDYIPINNLGSIILGIIFMITAVMILVNTRYKDKLKYEKGGKK